MKAVRVALHQAPLYESLPALPWEELSFTCAHTPLAHTLPDTSKARNRAKDYMSQIRSTPPGHLVHSNTGLTAIAGDRGCFEDAASLYSKLWHYL